MARLGQRQRTLGAGTVSDVIDAAWVVARFEDAGTILLSLPDSGPSPRLRISALEVVRAACVEAIEAPGKRLRPSRPSPARIAAMDEAWGWLGRIPDDRYVLRRIVGARALINPSTERHMFSWRRLGALLGADHRAVQRWHREGIDTIVYSLNRSGSETRWKA